MWIYVICNSDLNNILTECSILVDFRLKDFTTMSESDYILTNFMCAIDSFKKEIVSGGSNKTNNLTPYVIFSKTSMPDSNPDINIVRANSMQSARSNIDTTQGSIMGSMASSFRGLFK